MIVDDDDTGRFLDSLGSTLSLDFWSDLRVAAPTDIMVPPHNIDRFVSILDSRGLQYSIMMSNVGELVSRSKMVAGKMSWDVYHPLEDMYDYFDYLEGKKECTNIYILFL